MGREILGLVGDSLFIDKINLAFKTADAILQKKVIPCSEETTSNGRAIGFSILDDFFLELTPEISKFDSSSFPSINAESEQEFSWAQHPDFENSNYGK